MSWCSCATTTHKSQQIRKNCRMLKRDAERIAKRREEIPSNAPNRRSNLHFRLFKPAFRKHYFHFRFRWTLVTEPCINLWRYSGESDYTARNNRLQPKMNSSEIWVTRHAWGDCRVVDESKRCYLLIRMIATIFSFHSIGTIYFASLRPRNKWNARLFNFFFSFAYQFINLIKWLLFCVNEINSPSEPDSISGSAH